jgi:hypothetical protein
MILLIVGAELAPPARADQGRPLRETDNSTIDLALRVCVPHALSSFERTGAGFFENADC